MQHDFLSAGVDLKRYIFAQPPAVLFHVVGRWMSCALLWSTHQGKHQAGSLACSAHVKASACLDKDKNIHCYVYNKSGNN